MGSVYQAARERAAFIDRSSRGRILVRGGDRASYLQGLFTNEIAALEAGEGCYTAYLTAQGRMIADLWVYELGDLMLLDVPGEVKDTIAAKLDQFIFTEDVQLGDVTATFSQIAIVGPHASAILGTWLEHGDRLEGLREHGNFRDRIDDHPIIVTRVTDTGEPGFDVYIEQEHAPEMRQRLTSASVPEVDHGAAEALRIEGGIPAFHVDMDEDTIPLEAGIESRAISFTKGCYVGQEVIIRVLHRGHGRVARRLVGVAIDGDHVPDRGMPITSGGRDIGRVTSAVRSPAVGRPIALAYVRREFTAVGTALAIDDMPAHVVALPFVTSRSAVESAPHPQEETRGG